MQIEVKDLRFSYEKGGKLLYNINFTLQSGEKLGLVGPSGCGKSTLAKLLSGYLRPQSGEILLDGRPLTFKGFCPVQLIYQHPEMALNPRWRLRKSLCEAWEPDAELLKGLGIEPQWLERYPAELSGGELQRLCIARVLAPETRFLLCDEISTMLDVITQAQIWELLLKISEERKLGLLVITHNMPLAKRVCDKIIELPDPADKRPDPA